MALFVVGARRSVAGMCLSLCSDRDPGDIRDDGDRAAIAQMKGP